MAGRRKKPDTGDVRDLEKRLSTLVSDLEVLRKDMRGTAQAGGEYVEARANGAYGAARESANDALNGARDAASDALHAARATANDALAQAMDALKVLQGRAEELKEQVEDWTEDNVGTLRETVREQPILAVAISMSLGALIGALFLRRR